MQEPGVVRVSFMQYQRPAKQTQLLHIHNYILPINRSHNTNSPGAGSGLGFNPGLDSPVFELG